jgi:AraC-like DNA-binding protein
MEPTSVVPLRPHWLEQVTAACQRVVGRLLGGCRDEFVSGIDAFVMELPGPVSALEHQLLRDRVIATLARGGDCFHQSFHNRSRVGSCGGSPLDCAAAAWRNPVHDLAAQTRRWAALFLSEFDSHHARPVAWQAAAYMERTFAEPLRLDHMAAALAAGRATMTRQFVQTFGLSMSEYQMRLRLREAIAHLRASESKVDAVARVVGYSSTKNFYRALRGATGLTPTQVRQLPEHDVWRLLNSLVPQLAGGGLDEVSGSRQLTLRSVRNNAHRRGHLIA